MGLLRFALHGPGKSEICNFDMPINPDKEVLGLQIPVNDIFWVNIIQANQYLQEIELGLVLFHTFDSFQLIEQLTTWTV